jgi:calcineurin-like phosphoesterase family protein
MEQDKSQYRSVYRSDISYPPDKVFFTSDTHFCHANVVEYSERPFRDVVDMNETLIHNWNEVIPKDGIVFHLGDFCFGKSNQWNDVLNRLNGTIHLILGNHDLRMARRDFMARFASVQFETMIHIDKQWIMLNHFPMLCYAHSRWDWQLYGHIHTNPRNNKIMPLDRMGMLMSKQYDVGVDNNNFYPVSFRQLEKIIKFQVETGKRWVTERSKEQ